MATMRKAELQARAANCLFDWIAGKKTRRYKVHPSLEQVAWRHGYCGQPCISEAARRHLGARPRTLLERCWEAESMAPLFKAMQDN